MAILDESGALQRMSVALREAIALVCMQELSAAAAEVLEVSDDAGGTRYRVLAGAPGALLERRLRTLARGALVLAVIATASSIFLSEVSKGESEVTTTSSTASP